MLFWLINAYMVNLELTFEKFYISYPVVDPVFALSCSSVQMEEASVIQGAQGMLVQNWPTVSSAAGGDI